MILRLLDIPLSRFWAWRRLRGGTWIHVFAKPVMCECWIRAELPIPGVETLIERETWG